MGNAGNTNTGFWNSGNVNTGFGFTTDSGLTNSGFDNTGTEDLGFGNTGQFHVGRLQHGQRRLAGERRDLGLLQQGPRRGGILMRRMRPILPFHNR